MHSTLVRSRHLIHHDCRKHRGSHSGWFAFSHAVLLRCICLIYDRKLSKGIRCLRVELCPYLPYILPHSLSRSIFLSPLSCKCCHAIADSWREDTHMHGSTHTTHTHSCVTSTYEWSEVNSHTRTAGLSEHREENPQLILVNTRKTTFDVACLMCHCFTGTESQSEIYPLSNL